MLHILHILHICICSYFAYFAYSALSNLKERRCLKPLSWLGREQKRRLLKDILGTLKNVADHYDTSVICASSPQVQLLVNAISLFEMWRWRNLQFAICWSPSLNFLWLANGLLCSAQHVSCLNLRGLAFSELKAQLTADILSELKENPFFSKYICKGSRTKKRYFTVRIKIEK